MPSKFLIGTHERLSDCMDEMLRCFKTGAVITVVIRNPGYRNADLVLGNDDLDAAIGAIQTLKVNSPTFKIGDPVPEPDTKVAH